jgi:hypothetical protein
MCAAIGRPNAYRNEKVWTLLVADLLAHAPNQQALVDLLCGGRATIRERLDVWFEAQPLAPRKGTAGDSEGNTRVDLAFGHAQARGATGAGIEYGPHVPGSWVCFAEAKCMADCSSDVTYDPLRNQLTRVIENALTFQANGVFPEQVFFTLLTPRLFKDNPGARLYAYKMREYEDRKWLLHDLKLCRIPVRSGDGYVYPDLAQRLDRLTLTWTTYEELLEHRFGADHDIVNRPSKITGLKEHLEALVAAMQVGVELHARGLDA